MESLASRYTQRTGRKSFHYIVSIDNVVSIMRQGILSYEQAQNLVHEDISLVEVQRRREIVEVVKNETHLHQYANLYFDARNPMMYLRRHERDILCVLCVDNHVIELPGTVVSDRNASSEYVRFLSPEQGVNRLDFARVFASDWRDEDAPTYYEKKSKKCAEVLVRDRIPPRYIVGALVCDTRARSALQLRLASAGVSLDVRIYPDVFFA